MGTVLHVWFAEPGALLGGHPGVGPGVPDGEQDDDDCGDDDHPVPVS
jgi:hypothetical protein